MNTQKTDQTTPHSAWRWILCGHTGVFGPIACLLLLTALLASALPALASTNDAGSKRALDTMTVNLYIGTGTEGVTSLDPTDPNFGTNLVTAVTGVYYELLASQPPVRLQGVANQIVARMPDIVAVEEATLLRTQSPGDSLTNDPTPATHVVFDYLQILMDALNARGVHYSVAVTTNEIDIELPMFNLGTGSIDDVRWTDREAILVRADLPPGQLGVSNAQSGHFTNLLQFPGLGLSVPRGWCSVDLFIRGQNLRYICAHLEEETSAQIQVLQAQELLAGPVQTLLPVVLVGDFNSDPLHRDRPPADPTAYPKIIAAGFQDAWAVLHPSNPAGGLTWGHDEYLAFPGVVFDRRIDFVFFRGPGFIPTTADPIDMVLNRAAPPLWASDHAALAAELQIDVGSFAKTGAH